MTRARARARVLHKSGRNGEKVDRETPSGSEYPRRMRCAKLHLMLPAHQAGWGGGEQKERRGERERKMRKETRIQERATETHGARKESGQRETETTEGTLLSF